MSVFSQVFSKASQGALVLTANKRLSRYLRDRYDLWMQQNGHKLWTTPQLYSYEGWLNLCLNELGESWRLLNPHQERTLWEQQIEASSRGSSLELLQLAQTADQACRANHLLNDYDLIFDQERASEDQRMFLVWRKLYRQRCAEQGWIDKSQVTKKLCAALNGGSLSIPEELLLVGFDQLSPGLEALLSVAEKAGTHWENIASVSGYADAQVIRFAARDKTHEVESAARWTRRLLERGESSIGIVVPDLVQQRRLIERVFRHQIDPLASVELNQGETAFSLSLGGSLAEQGVIHAALTLLNIDWSVTVEQMSFLLRTPYLGGARSEADARALFDRRLRSYQQKNFNLVSVIALAEQTAGLATFHQLLQAIEHDARIKVSAPPGGWAQRFADQLHTLGWPGERTVSSGEYQAVKSWRGKVLEALATLDTIKPAATRRQALSLLRRMTVDTDFQFEGATGAVQVVGLLESSGLDFDHLWVMGMNDTQLPAQPRPNPFIPFRLQEKHAMPHASTDRELHFAQQVVQRLQSASPDSVFSYVTSEGDSPLNPSPLITECGEPGIPLFAELSDSLNLMMQTAPQLDSWFDNQGPTVSPGTVAGGIALLKDQAHCPFRAFVHHRLNCRALEEPASGVSPIMRGDLVHLALEQIWLLLKTQDNLIAMQAGELEKLVHQQVEKAVNGYFHSRVGTEEFLQQLEAQRIESLVLEWLTEVESGRDPFEVVATEQQLERRIGDLQVRIKIDRIDEVQDGSRIIIDYKTGTDFKAEDFLSSPLIEPQLPVYAIADEHSRPDGVAFAQVRKGGCRFVGIARENSLLDRVKELSSFSQAAELGIHDWAELLVVWERELDQLAADFTAGKADVFPYDPKQSCRFCDLIGLCRVQENRHIEEFENE
ncbi:MAG: PD-(D/E)XK nuclease family protein [Desulfuromonadales bacterium]|nr:PD-(D/E)XK nuclease family protein [Desulfuromonadales bacterium]